MREKLRAVVRESTFHQNVIMQPVFGFLSPLRIFENSELAPVNSSIKKNHPENIVASYCIWFMGNFANIDNVPRVKVGKYFQ